MVALAAAPRPGATPWWRLKAAANENSDAYPSDAAIAARRASAVAQALAGQGHPPVVEVASGAIPSSSVNWRANAERESRARSASVGHRPRARGVLVQGPERRADRARPPRL